MTDIVTPPTINALPPAPRPADTPSEFDGKAFALLAAQVAMVGDFNSAAAATQQNATAANERAIAAQDAAVTAATASNTALAASNFKGEWSSLTGDLPKPACVKHSGRFWVLLNSLANVAASQPGISADWAALDAGTVPSSVITTNTTGIVGVRYLLAASGITLTAPTTWLKGDYFGFREVAGSTTSIVDFGSTKQRGRSVGAVTVDVAYQGMDLFYEDATRGLI